MSDQRFFEKDMKHHSSELGLASFAPSTLTVRDARPAAIPRRRRAGMPSSWAAATRRFSTAPAGSRSSNPSSAIARISSTPSDAGRIVGVLPLAHVNSWLFGNALVSLPFAVYGGVAAESRRGRDGARRRGAGAGANGFGVDASRAAQRRARGIRIGRRRISTSRSARRSCPTSRPTCSPFRASSGRWCARASKNGLRERDRSRRRSLLRAVRRQRPSPRHAGAAQALFRGAACACSARTARC